MATTTNYSWTTPDDTALVKDGAAAIRTLGSSIDTTTKALNPSTTLGDIEYRSSTANTNTRLGIGSTGDVLTVTGGVPVWAAPAGAGGLTLLSTTTLSGTSTVISSIDQTYTNLLIIGSGISFPNQNCFLDFNSTTTSMSYCGLYGVSPTTYGASDSRFSFTMGNAPLNNNTDNAFALNVYNYASSSYHKAWTIDGRLRGDDTGANDHQFLFAGSFRSNTAISSLRLSTTSTNWGGGQILIYGVK
jgi:hypothetical protein